MYCPLFASLCSLQSALHSLTSVTINVKLGFGSGLVFGLQLGLGLGQKIASCAHKFRNFAAHVANCED